MNDNIIYVGIDPGKKGALVVFDNKLDIKISQDFDKECYINILKNIKETKKYYIITIEKVHSIYGDGGKSSFNFGSNFGWILGVLDTLQMSYNLIDPLKWKSFYKLKREKKEKIQDFKIRSCKLAIELNNKIEKDIIIGTVSKGINKGNNKYNDGIAEAFLIGLYGKENRYEV